MTVKQIQHLLGHLGTSQGRQRQAPSGISVDGIANWNGKGTAYYIATDPSELSEQDLWVHIAE